MRLNSPPFLNLQSKGCKILANQQPVIFKYSYENHQSLFFIGRPLAVQAFTVVAADEPNQRNLQVVGLMVVAPDGGQDNRSYCWKPGVTVSVRYAPVQGTIVSFNENLSKLDSFTDDKGTDLMAAPPSTDPFNKPGISGMLPVAQDGATSMIFDLKASGQPANGATAFTITGKASVQVAASTKQFTVDNVEIKTNAAFRPGGFADRYFPRREPTGTPGGRRTTPMR